MGTIHLNTGFSFLSLHHPNNRLESLENIFYLLCSSLKNYSQIQKILEGHSPPALCITESHPVIVSIFRFHQFQE